ncbi:DDT domain-containing protein DDR4-like isoform X2 [Mangifera indica]|uniref:DDT domain-containing protein DDR4-like isoform X2 n=1 Tax=Mangifera indica TaxID=29780 RepID=UPI001CFB6596|nr:DDT domain-containing protein DDR4-like isoform X2 [Mangifera indica]
MGTCLCSQFLNGIPPVSKLLNDSDAWVSVLRKKLALWWPWVAEGETPLTAVKGYDGNTSIGYRLYKEVNKTGLKTKCKGKAFLTLPATCAQWKTLATFSRNFAKLWMNCHLAKLWQKLLLARQLPMMVFLLLKSFIRRKKGHVNGKKRQEMLLLNGFRNSFAVGITRSYRSRRSISYTFDDYDQAIDEAIELLKKCATSKEQRHGKSALNEGSVMETKMEKSYDKEGDSTGSDTESDT